MRSALLCPALLFLLVACGGSDDGTGEVRPDGISLDASLPHSDTDEPDLGAPFDADKRRDAGDLAAPTAPDVPVLPDLESPLDVALPQDLSPASDVPLSDGAGPADVPAVEDVALAPDVPTSGPDVPPPHDPDPGLAKCGSLADCQLLLGTPGPCQVMYCEDARCLVKSLDDGTACGGPSCGGGGTCLAGRCDCPGACVPVCGDRTCGDDGCGGSCGACNAPCDCVNGRCLVELEVTTLCSNTVAQVPSGWPVPIVMTGRVNDASDRYIVRPIATADGNTIHVEFVGRDYCNATPRSQKDLFGATHFQPPADGIYTVVVPNRPDMKVQVGGEESPPVCDLGGCGVPLDTPRWTHYLWAQGNVTFCYYLPPLASTGGSFPVTFDGSCRDYTTIWGLEGRTPDTLRQCTDTRVLFGEGPVYRAEATRCMVPWEFLLYVDLWVNDRGFVVSTYRGLRRE